jgi:hypothetical protein
MLAGRGTAWLVAIPFVAMSVVEDAGWKSPALVPVGVNAFALEGDAPTTPGVMARLTPFTVNRS